MAHPHTVRLPAPDDSDAALRALARLIADQVPPDAVHWQLGPEPPQPLAHDAPDGAPRGGAHAPFTRQAGLFDDAGGGDHWDNLDNRGSWGGGGDADAGHVGNGGDDGDGGHHDANRAMQAPDAMGGPAADDATAGAAASATAGTMWPHSPARPAQALWRLPAELLALLRLALLHDGPQRHRLVHGLAQRVCSDPRHAHDLLHPERLQVERMAREVRRELHKTHAFVRFRPVTAPTGATGPVDDDPCHVAWFEPRHHVLRLAAPFFQRRFAAMRWAILTPRGSVAWDRQRLRFGPPARREDAPAADADDAGQALWLAYYRSTFNPARANPALMRREMPVRYWPHLPEAALIGPLLRDAAARTQGMAAATADTARRLPRALRTSPPAPAASDATSAPCAPSSALSTPQALGQAHGQAQEQARQRLRQLGVQVAQCQACPASGRATQAVLGRGGLQPLLMLVGEQPGEQEHRAGRPFVGPAGQLLQRAIAQLGWPLNRLYVTNAVKHFHHVLRGTRRLHKTPPQQAVATCLDWLEAEVQAVDPVLLVALGRTAAQALGAGDAPRMRRADGRVVHRVLHPAALLRQGMVADDDQAPALVAWREGLAAAWAEAQALAQAHPQAQR